MRKFGPPMFFALLSGAGLAIAGRDLPPLPVPRPEAVAMQSAAAAVEDWKLDLGQPASLRLTLSPSPPNAAWSVVGLSASQAPRWNSRPLSRLKLFDSGGPAAGRRNGGQIQYTLSGVNPLGATVGARLSTKS